MTDTAVSLDADADADELLGGRYRLRELIGEGGMARVYRADDLVLGRTVAVKILRGTADGISGGERARIETRLLATLSYHSLVTLFDAHVSGSGPSYLVMEYVEGKTLRDRIEAGALPAQEVAALAVDLAEALHVVHAAGIVHRDVKPSNVLLCPSPVPGREFRAKIADFGIAYLLDSTHLTVPGTVMGTAAYLAPEQVRGAPPAPPADIYGLGLVLLEALTGRGAFAPAEGVEAVVVRLTAPPRIPDDLDPQWHHLLAWMTAREPGDRPAALDVVRAATELRRAAHPPVPLLTPASSDALPETQPLELASIPPAAAHPLPTSETVPTATLRPRGRHVRRRRQRAVIALAAGALAVGVVGAAHAVALTATQPPAEVLVSDPAPVSDPPPPDAPLGDAPAPQTVAEVDAGTDAGTTPETLVSEPVRRADPVAPAPAPGVAVPAPDPVGAGGAPAQDPGASDSSTVTDSPAAPADGAEATGDAGSSGNGSGKGNGGVIGNGKDKATKAAKDATADLP